MMKNEDLVIRELGTGQISKALAANLDMRFGSLEPKVAKSDLLKFLEANHAATLSECCFIDLTIYEYGRESLPFFYVLASGENKIDSYITEIKKFLEPTPTATGKFATNSVALHPQFRLADSLKVIELSPVTEVTPITPAKSLGFCERRYPLRDYGPHKFEYPSNIEDSLLKFRVLLEANRMVWSDPQGRPINNVVCVNFLVPRGRKEAPRSLGQLFLGLSSTALNATKDSIDSRLKGLLSDVALLLYRNCAGSLILSEGLDASRQTFSHRAKPLIEVLIDWTGPITEYFSITKNTEGVIARLLPEQQNLEIEEIGIIPLRTWHRLALLHVLSWTMARSKSDLPFYDDFESGKIPSSCNSLAGICHDSAWQSYLFALLHAVYGGRLPKSVDDLIILEPYLRSLKPKLIVNGDASGHMFEWADAALVDLARLLMVVFREAFQHGAWSDSIAIKCEYSADKTVINLAVENARMPEHGEEECFSSIPAGISTTKADFYRARLVLHNDIGSFGKSQLGRREIQLLANSVGGELNGMSDPSTERQKPWRVDLDIPSVLKPL